ncbi:MAG TPA: dynamin family protein, partial [Polyangia bacterium]|nr:dynamin family protein [Polyangia bacterium]
MTLWERDMGGPAASWSQLKGDPRIRRLGDLQSRARALATEASVDRTQYPIIDDTDWLDRVVRRVASTFTVMVIGQVSSGKSSFVNSLFGRRLLMPSDAPTDGVVSVLLPTVEGQPERAERVLRNGQVVPF